MHSEMKSRESTSERCTPRTLSASSARLPSCFACIEAVVAVETLGRVGPEEPPSPPPGLVPRAESGRAPF